LEQEHETYMTKTLMSSESENIMVLQKKINVVSLNMKGGPGATVEPTVCNQKVPGSSLSLHTFVLERLGA